MPLGPLAAVRETVRRLAAPDGCAWHGVQTHESLTPFLVEEAAEFIDAIERGLPAEEVAGELGDVLYQVLFHAAIAERDGEGYDLDAIAEALNEKLIARHPHVFGDRGYMSVEELHAEWERLKEDAAGERRGSRSALAGIPAGMPTLARAAKVIERLKRAGFLDVEASLPRESRRGATAPGFLDVEASLPRESRRGATSREPLDPAAATGEQTSGAETAGEEALGDAMLALLMRANANGLDADRALRGAVRRLAGRLDPESPADAVD